MNKLRQLNSLGFNSNETHPMHMSVEAGRGVPSNVLELTGLYWCSIRYLTRSAMVITNDSRPASATRQLSSLGLNSNETRPYRFGLQLQMGTWYNNSGNIVVDLYPWRLLRNVASVLNQG
jgi:hypothetical protein